ncbi:uncharacterized protein DNG_10495 [Cephalotrichum gorgonifer]|uniref:Uncharacterized protein n=1 Tax=Cephalotrichum gorgonifer TaxID=2041049 RepID=A0AAE8T0B2_9PEZI|nr:uncharacterized protein DNG_10495 [Cephalotrichum gorgonifer]
MRDNQFIDFIYLYSKLFQAFLST